MDNLSPLNDISSKAFDELLSRFNSLDTNKLLVYLVDTVDASALPHLAEQFHILGNEGWLFASAEQEKRELIKNAIELHRYKGTKYALRKVLEILNLNGKIREWFEYQGNPYRFMVSIDLKNRGFNSVTEKQLLDLIEETKNVRSIMETLEVNLTNSADYRLRTAMITSEEVTI
ncbi:MAG TPA: phage tail protein I [Candidatus Gastranaerophilales bacterium]|nr:phage tail protein I [Candidatus Gastranaerophilales bacterium]